MEGILSTKYVAQTIICFRRKIYKSTKGPYDIYKK